jgi:hypothetical protein
MVLASYRESRERADSNSEEAPDHDRDRRILLHSTGRINYLRIQAIYNDIKQVNYRISIAGSRHQVISSSLLRGRLLFY